MVILLMLFLVHKVLLVIYCYWCCMWWWGWWWCCRCYSGDSCCSGNSCGSGDSCCSGDGCSSSDGCGSGINGEGGTGVVSSVMPSIHTTICIWMNKKHKNKINTNILCHTACIRVIVSAYVFSRITNTQFSKKCCGLILVCGIRFGFCL